PCCTCPSRRRRAPRLPRASTPRRPCRGRATTPAPGTRRCPCRRASKPRPARPGSASPTRTSPTPAPPAPPGGGGGEPVDLDLRDLARLPERVLPPLRRALLGPPVEEPAHAV